MIKRVVVPLENDHLVWQTFRKIIIIQPFNLIPSELPFVMVNATP